MRSPERSYQCAVCRWQGRQEPTDAGDAAPCPQCGVLLYPLSWARTWGAALALVGGTVAFVFVAALVMARR